MLPQYEMSEKSREFFTTSVTPLRVEGDLVLLGRKFTLKGTKLVESIIS
jgi:hypothetical protein